MRHPTTRRQAEQELLDYPIFTPLASAKDKLLIPPSIKAIALDFDGTTMKFKFTEGLRQEGYRRAIQSVGLELLGRRLTKSEIDQCHGPAVGKCEVLMSNIIADKLSDLTKQQVDPNVVWERWLEQGNVLLSKHQELYGRPAEKAIIKGIIPLVVEAAKRNIPVSICTAGAYQFVEPLLKHGGLLEHLHLEGNVYVNMNPGIRSKPHADPYLLVAKKLKVDPSEVLAAEDSSTGALAGLRAGVQVMLQPSGNRAKTLYDIVAKVRAEHREWLQDRPGAITLLSYRQGWRQVEFP